MFQKVYTSTYLFLFLSVATSYASSTKSMDSYASLASNNKEILGLNPAHSFFKNNLLQGNLRVVSSENSFTGAKRSLLGATTYNTVFYYNNEPYSSHGFYINVCVCGTDSHGASQCHIYTQTNSIYSGGVAIIDTVYQGASGCDGTFTSTYTIDVPSTYKNVTIGYCGESKYEESFPITINTYIGGASEYSKLGSGQVILSYPSSSSCNAAAAFYSYYDFIASPVCGIDMPNACDTNITVVSDSADEATASLYSNNRCNELLLVLSDTYPRSCLPTNNFFDDKFYNDEHNYYENYYTTTFQGYSSNDDGVVLTSSEFGGLVASVFIALLLGIAVTAFVCWRYKSASKSDSDNIQSSMDKNLL